MANELTPLLGQSFTAYLNSSTFTSILNYVFFVIILLTLVFSIIFISYFVTYKDIVWIYEPFGSKLRKYKKDRCKLINKKDKDPKLRLFWARKYIKPVDPSIYVPTKKGKELNLIFDGVDYHPLDLSPNPGFKAIDINLALWHAQTGRELIEDYGKKGFWDKYGGLVVTGLTVFFCVGALIATIYFVNHVAGKAIDTYARAIEATGQKFISKPP